MILKTLWIFIKILAMNWTKVLPKVFLKIIGLLEADKSRNEWKLSRSPDGNYSLVINHIPANNQERSSEVQHRSMPGSQLQQQDTTAVLEVPPLRRRSGNQRLRGGSAMGRET